MKPCFYFIVLAIFLASCGGGKKKEESKTNTVDKAQAIVTPNEQTAIKEITDFYGGACNLTTGVSKDGKKRYARLEMSKSPALDSAVNITELNLANLALVFYKDLHDERNNFDEIQTAILFGDAQKAERTFPTSTLAMVADKTVIVAKIIDLLKAQNYDGLDRILNEKSGLVSFNKKMLIDQIKKSDPPLGKIKSFIPYGFIFIKADNGKQILHIAGMMIREKNNNEFSVDIDPASTQDEAIFINYKL